MGYYRNMDSNTRDDFLWLTSDEAAEVLDQTREAILERVNVVRIAKSLRARTTVTRAAMVIEQAQLRIRAKKKFPLAERMFFTRKGLEQSSGAEIAKYKAKRFAGVAKVADVCCGIGGDLLALIERPAAKRTVGVDVDKLACLFARKNAQIAMPSTHEHKTSIVKKPFADLSLEKYDGLHIDPDRRVNERTTVGSRFSPSLDEVFGRVSDNQNLAIKIAPATRLAHRFPEACQREWIGDRRECKQQVIWCGPFTKKPGCRSATCIERDESVHHLSVPEHQVDQTIVFAKKLRNYIFEPHPTVLAAGLTDAMGNRYDINRFSPGIAYLTGDHEIKNPLLCSFEIVELLPVDLRQTVQFLKRQDIGTVEVKNRGIESVVVEKFRRMKLKGPNRATLILTRIGNRRVVIITRRKATDFELVAQVTA